MNSRINPADQFNNEVRENTKNLGSDRDLIRLSRIWARESSRHKYSYNFSWMGRPIIQYPQDIVAMQELIWKIQPDLIIETGIAHGGSLVFSASMLALLDHSEAIRLGTPLSVMGRPERRVLGVDIDIRVHNKTAIEAHPLAPYIEMIQGSSISSEVIAQVTGFAKKYKKVLVCLDSNHTHDHVLAELRAYAPLTSAGSYCVVFDTIIEDMPADMFPDRPWGAGNSPKTAVFEFLSESDRFEIDDTIDAKLQISVAPSGYLKCIKD